MTGIGADKPGMSALGQKQTFEPRKAMSALCQKRTLAFLFDHLVSGSN
jgi:hypothetical protein